MARPAMRSQGFLAIGSGSARSHHQGSEECRHSYECLLMAQWQTEDLEGTVANRLWRWYAHRPEDSEDMVANRLWRWHAHGSIYSMGDFPLKESYSFRIRADRVDDPLIPAQEPPQVYFPLFSLSPHHLPFLNIRSQLSDPPSSRAIGPCNHHVCVSPIGMQQGRTLSDEAGVSELQILPRLHWQAPKLRGNAPR